MTLLSVLICLFSLTSLPLLAQHSTVRFDRGQLVFEREGWRIHLDRSARQFGGLLDDDLIQVIGGIPSSRVGPPAILSIFASADPQSVRLTVKRGDTPVKLTFWSGEGPSPRPKPISPTVSRSFKAPDFSLKSPDGKTVSLSENRKYWTVVNFWGTWCGSCIVELPEMESIARTRTPRINVVGLAVMDENSDILSFLRKHPLPYPVAKAGDKSSPVLRRYGLLVPGGRLGVPVTAILRPGGEIAYMQAGGTENHLASIIAKLVQDDNRRHA
ncbi:peroxiredoxin [Granulicella mallensis]|uniref:Peroxiredoxin n=2 Tax=Granulicella mallensis TaxID=940614 RepID=A0A7W8EC25_9BACT|nr:peroxiredoxin [Granulicella mallensis]